MGMVCTTPEALAEKKANAEILCQNNQGQCSYDTKVKLNNFFLRVERTSERVDALKKAQGGN